MFSRHFELAAIVTAQKNFGPGFVSQKLDRLQACDQPIKFTDRVFSTSVYGPHVKLEGHEIKWKNQGAVTYSQIDKARLEQSVLWNTVS